MLFCPGNQPDKVAKVFSRGADAVILDLEDAVPINEKVATRPAVAAAMRQPRNCKGYVRVNATGSPFCHGDIFEIVGPGLDGIVLPKAESAADIQIVDWALTAAERQAGIAPGSIDLVPLVETAAGVLRAEAIASASPRVRRVAFGAADFTLDTSMTWSKSGQELLWARTHLVLASRAANKESPIDTVYIDLKDMEGLEQDTEMGRRLGFQGRLVIYPGHVPVANRIYSPTPAQVQWSRKVVAAFEEAERNGSAAIQLDGQFVDYPIVFKAKQVLELAERLGMTAEESAG